MAETVQGFEVDLERAYDCEHHLWIETVSPDRVRIGMDPLGIETSGTLAQLDFAPPGTVLTRGDQFGSLEAEKFVGPLVAPLSGTVVAVNESASANATLVEQRPFTDGWMIELAPSNLEDEVGLLTSGADEVIAEFERRIDEYRRDGVLAE